MPGGLGLEKVPQRHGLRHSENRDCRTTFVHSCISKGEQTCLDTILKVFFQTPVCCFLQANPEAAKIGQDERDPDHAPRCFEIMGFDVFVDEDLRYNDNTLSFMRIEKHHGDTALFNV